MCMKSSARSCQSEKIKDKISTVEHVCSVQCTVLYARHIRTLCTNLFSEIFCLFIFFIHTTFIHTTSRMYFTYFFLAPLLVPRLC